MKCEICGGEVKGVCPRCYRFVCDRCVDPTTLECVDCTSVKRVMEEDLVRYVDNLTSKLKFIEKNINSCFSCPLLKDAVMSYVRKAKELESIAKLNSYEMLYDKVKEFKDKAQQVAIKYLIKIKSQSS